MSIRVFLLDHHRAFTGALAVRLEMEEDVTLVGAAATSQEAEAPLRSGNVDVLIVDVDLGRENGLEVAAAAQAMHAGLQVVVLTSDDDAGTAEEALRLGCAGFVSKDACAEELLTAVRAATRGELSVSASVLTPLLRRLLEPVDGRPARANGLSSLTPREREVLDCMVRGMDRAAIGSHLFLSTNTVRTHTRNILAKLDVHSALEAVAVARRGRRPSGSVSP